MKKMTKKRQTECATIRVMVKMTKEDSAALRRLCEDEVRTVGSWFRLQVKRAWEVYSPSGRYPTGFQRNEDDGVKRMHDVWARLTETERDQLDVLADASGVSVSVWFRARLREDLKRRAARKRK